MIHTAPQNVYFILQYHLFSHKEFFFSNVYISLNTIFECSYLSFRSEIDHPLSMCVTREMEWGSSKMCTGVYMGRGVSRLKCMLMMMYGRTPHTSKGQGHTPHHIASCLGPTSLLASYITLSSMVHLLRIQNKAFILFYGLRLALFVMPTGQLFVFVMRFSISDFCFSVSVIHFLSLVSNI